jgi:hypothetical protein
MISVTLKVCFQRKGYQYYIFASTRLINFPTPYVVPLLSVAGDPEALRMQYDTE